MKASSIRTQKTLALIVTCGLLMGTTAFGEDFQITIENLSPNVLTPAPFIAHNAMFDLFDLGQPASAAIELLAEDGMPTGVAGMATVAMGTSVSNFDIAFGAGGPIVPGESVTVTINTDASHPMLSFASMFAFSNDAFIGRAAGEGAIDLFPGGVPFQGAVTITPQTVWDAGTEVNDELAAHVPALGAALNAGTTEFGLIAQPHTGILGIGDIPLDRDWTGGDVARITIVPEPASLAILLAGSALFAARRRKPTA